MSDVNVATPDAFVVVPVPPNAGEKRNTRTLPIPSFASIELFAFPSLKTFAVSVREPAAPKKNGEDVFVSRIARLLSAVSLVLMSTV